MSSRGAESAKLNQSHFGCPLACRQFSPTERFCIYFIGYQRWRIKKSYTPHYTKEKKMINLHEKGSNKPLGSISEAQLQFLIDRLEEEWLEDHDYAITSLVVDSFEAEGADPALV